MALSIHEKQRHRHEKKRKTMINRTHRARDAQLALEGACNPIALIHSLHMHMKTMREKENAGMVEVQVDAGIRALIYQLAHVCKAGPDMELIAFEGMCDELKRMAEGA